MSGAAQPPAKRRRVTFGDTETRTYAPARSSTDPRRPRADDAEDVHRARGGRRGGAQRAAAVAAAGSGSAEGDEYDESVVALVLMRVVQDVEIQADADKLKAQHTPAEPEPQPQTDMLGMAANKKDGGDEQEAAHVLMQKADTMAEWSEAQVSEWISRIELPDGCAQAVQDVCSEMDGQDLLEFNIRPLQKLLRKAGAQEPEAAAKAILWQRDNVDKEGRAEAEGEAS